MTTNPRIHHKPYMLLSALLLQIPLMGGAWTAAALEEGGPQGKTQVVTEKDANLRQRGGQGRSLAGAAVQEIPFPKRACEQNFPLQIRGKIQRRFSASARKGLCSAGVCGQESSRAPTSR